MRRPRRPAKAGGRGGGGGEAPLEAAVAVGVKEAEGAAVIAIDGEGPEASVLGVPVVAAAGDGSREKASLEVGLAVGEKDALDGAPVTATDGKGEMAVQGDPMVTAGNQQAHVPVVEEVQAIAVKGNGKAEKDEEGIKIKWLKHYSSAQSILVVGDGDFSFSLALATAFGSGDNLVATSLDSYGALTSKYAKAQSNVSELERLGARVVHGIDAKAMRIHPSLMKRLFDRIVFNFPHAGFKGKEDHQHVIKAHKQLVHGFFANARHMLRPYGEIHISHKTGHPYDAWDIEQLSNHSCLTLVRRVGFSKEDYPGYNQKRGDSAMCDKPFALGPCCTFMFCLGDVKKLKKARGNSKSYHGISAADMRPFDLHPPAPAWPQPHFPPVNRVQMPISFVPLSYGVAPGFLVNLYGTGRAPYFHHQGMVQQPMCSGPPLNVFPTHGSFHPPMMRILANLEQPWYPEGPPVVPPWSSDYPYSPQEQHQCLQREYGIHTQQMGSFQMQARLEMLIAHYGGH